jgi:hypothetical protein
MALRLAEFFGYPVGDPKGLAFAGKKRCPFVGGDCIKPDHGACSLQALKDPTPVICCPNRLYAGDLAILKLVSDLAFAGDHLIVNPEEARGIKERGQLTGSEVVAFGRYSGQELPLPKAGPVAGSYYMDWVLARLNTDGRVAELTALEVQTIDTTGSYRQQAEFAFLGKAFTDRQGRTPGYSDAGFNWENVNKRILPQVIYKGHALRRERLCTRGLFFACPKHVLDRIMDRLGGVGGMHEYPMQAGTVTFIAFDLDALSTSGSFRPLKKPTTFTTTIDQVALAFTAPRNLPDAGIYELAANLALGNPIPQQ